LLHGVIGRHDALFACAFAGFDKYGCAVTIGTTRYRLAAPQRPAMPDLHSRI
jgi:hypothetical protein